MARIRTSSTFAPAGDVGISVPARTTSATFSPNPNVNPGTRPAGGSVVGVFPTINYLGAGAAVARAGVTEIEFVDFGFAPTLLKVCKIAGTGFPLNTPVTFDVAVVSPNTIGGVPGGTTPIFTAFTVPVTVNAGPAAQGGNCTFVDPALGTGTLLGTSPAAFDIGSTVTITERGTSTVTAITSSTVGTGGLTTNLTTRTATLSGANGLVAGVNIVTFTNSTTVAPPGGDVKFDFNGDGRSDISVYRPSDTTWYVARSTGVPSQNFDATKFGLSTDTT
ncbi:MAG: hypothetical protein ABR566_18010, partial [Pyrinomonadaceae bacterium]